jgi:hypothetical protein
VSGGSFNYLCHRPSDMVLEARGDLEKMAVELELLATRAVPNALPAAEETRRLLGVPTDILDGIVDPLRDVWKAVEWWFSSDWSFDRVTEALEAFHVDVVEDEDGDPYPDELQPLLRRLAGDDRDTVCGLVDVARLLYDAFDYTGYFEPDGLTRRQRAAYDKVFPR